MKGAVTDGYALQTFFAGIHSQWCVKAADPVVCFRILRCLLQVVVQLLHLSLIEMF